MKERIYRINRIIEFLGITRNLLAKTSGLASSNLSKMMAGKQAITNKTLEKICNAFPMISIEWLRSGMGDMIKEDVPMVQNGDGGVHQQGHAGSILNQTANSEKLVMEFIDSLKAQSALTAKSMSQTDKVIEELSEQRKLMDRLITIIENK